jgi:hypothetical protein
VLDYFDSGLKIKNLGAASKGNRNLEDKYLIVDPSVDVVVREVPQRSGGTRYAIDQQANPTSIAFWPGGVYANNAIIAGEFSTCSNDPASRHLLQKFAEQIKRRFTAIKSYFVGKEATELLDRGFRLTADIRAPAEFDLVR